MRLKMATVGASMLAIAFGSMLAFAPVAMADSEICDHRSLTGVQGTQDRWDHGAPDTRLEFRNSVGYTIVVETNERDDSRVHRTTRVLKNDETISLQGNNGQASSKQKTEDIGVFIYDYDAHSSDFKGSYVGYVSAHRTSHDGTASDDSYMAAEQPVDEGSGQSVNKRMQWNLKESETHEDWGIDQGATLRAWVHRDTDQDTRYGDDHTVVHVKSPLYKITLRSL